MSPNLGVFENVDFLQYTLLNQRIKSGRQMSIFGQNQEKNINNLLTIKHLIIWHKFSVIKANP